MQLPATISQLSPAHPSVHLVVVSYRGIHRVRARHPQHRLRTTGAAGAWRPSSGWRARCPPTRAGTRAGTRFPCRSGCSTGTAWRTRARNWRCGCEAGRHSQQCARGGWTAAGRSGSACHRSEQIFRIPPLSRIIALVSSVMWPHQLNFSLTTSRERRDCISLHTCRLGTSI